MNKQINTYKVLGLMSGTSLDGLDLCLVSFDLKNNQWKFDIKACKTINYNESWLNKLGKSHLMKAEDLVQLDHEYGAFLGKEAKSFINSIGIKPDLIASHGHTVFHNPNLNFTKQIGNGAQLAIHSGFKTCCDFRTTDIALNGQGAPLVPIGDLKLFPNHNACLNLGGFSNISIKHKSKVHAFDVCPTNIVLNRLANQFGKDYDANGELAKSGQLNSRLLNDLNALDYYQLKGPKSLGREWAEENIYPLLDKFNLDSRDKLHTYCIHIAQQVKNSIKAYGITDEILLTGGGAKNGFLVHSFRKEGVKVFIPSNDLIDFKEALIFAFLGLLRVIESPNTISSVTGARKDSISGCIYLP